MCRARWTRGDREAVIGLGCACSQATMIWALVQAALPRGTDCSVYRSYVGGTAGPDFEVLAEFSLHVLTAMHAGSPTQA